MATAKSVIYARWKCSKCGNTTTKPITVKQSGPKDTAEIILGTDINMAVGDINYRHYLRSCRCKSCGHKEKWTKSRYCPLTAGLCTTGALILLVLGGVNIMEWSMPRSIIGIVMWAAIPALIYLAKIWNNKVDEYNKNLTFESCYRDPQHRPYVAQYEHELSLKEARAAVNYSKRKK